MNSALLGGQRTSRTVSTIAMNGFVVAGSAWAAVSLICGAVVSGWWIWGQASFANLDGVAGATIYFVWFTLIATWGGALAALPWMLALGWPTAVVTSFVSERWLRIAFPIAASALAGLTLYYLDPPLWTWPGAYVAPVYGVGVAYFNERFGHA